MKPKIIAVLGPTATGKSNLAVEIALQLRSGQTRKLGINGAEIISADSRQVYKGMNIGTGKITKKEMKGVPHHLLDVASPKKRFDVIQYKILAEKAIEKIIKKKKVPIICGGTGFYIDAIIKDINFPNVPPNWALRKKLEKKSTEELFKKLQKIDPERALVIDPKDKRRLIRAIEIVLATGKKVSRIKAEPKYETLKIGIKLPKETAREKIKDRLLKRLQRGMIAEVKKLKKAGLSWKRLYEFGLEYRYVSMYLKNELTYQKMIEKLNTAIWRYYKRQMTWFKKDKEIHWINNKREAKRLVEKFIKN